MQWVEYIEKESLKPMRFTRSHIYAIRRFSNPAYTLLFVGGCHKEDMIVIQESFEKVCKDIYPDNEGNL